MSTDFVIRLAEREIRISLERQHRKSLAVKVVSDSELQAKAPLLMDIEEIKSFLYQKQSWLLKRISRYEKWQGWPRPRKYVSGEPVLFRGECYFLDIRIQEKWKKHKLFVIDNRLEIWGPDKDSLKVRKALIAWLTEESREVIGTRLAELAKQWQISYSAFTLGNGKTLWGTCRQDGLIRINWRGIFLPSPMLDYLLIHELCHRLEMNHSSRFWQEVEMKMPDWKIQRKDLKEYGLLLAEMRE